MKCSNYLKLLLLLFCFLVEGCHLPFLQSPEMVKIRTVELDQSWLLIFEFSKLQGMEPVSILQQTARPDDPVITLEIDAAIVDFPIQSTHPAPGIAEMIVNATNRDTTLIKIRPDFKTDIRYIPLNTNSLVLFARFVSPGGEAEDSTREGKEKPVESLIPTATPIGAQITPTPVFHIDSLKLPSVSGEIQLNEPAAPGPAVVHRNNVNVRSGPGTNSDILTELKLGTVVKVLKMSDQWTQIHVPNEGNGWILNQFLTVPGDEFMPFFMDPPRTVITTQTVTDPEQNLVIPTGVTLPVYQGTLTHEVMLPDTRRVILDPATYELVIDPTPIAEPLFELSGKAIKMPIKSGDTAIVVNTYANLRDQPSTRGRRTAQSLLGDAVDVIEVQGDWCKIRFGIDFPRSYWIAKHLLNGLLPEFAQACSSNQIAVCTAFSGISVDSELTIPFGAMLPCAIDQNRTQLMLPDGRILHGKAALSDLFSLDPLPAEDAIAQMKKWIGAPFKQASNQSNGIDGPGFINLFGRLTGQFVPADETAIRSLNGSIPLEGKWFTLLKPGDILISRTADPEVNRFSISIGNMQMLTCGMDVGIKIVDLDAHQISKVLKIARFDDLSEPPVEGIVDPAEEVTQ